MHTAFQMNGILPGILLGLRTLNDPIGEGEQAFILGSISYALENGEIPCQIRHFAEKKN